MNKGILIGGLVAVGLLIATLASGFGRDTHKVQSPLVGRVAPAFSLSRVDGKGTISLDTLKGKPAVVNFWATWCQPCKIEHSTLQQGARRIGSDVQFVGIVYEDEPDRINEFLNQYGGSAYPTVVDMAGKAAIAYGVAGVPETFFINAQGRIVSKYEGPLSPEMLEARVAELKGFKGAGL